MKITHIKVANYRGISALDADIADHGVIAQGRNGSGKTTLLKAIRAALAAQDVGPDAIRLGADRAEILVDLGDLTVRRLITSKSTSVTVETRAGDVKKKPQTVLSELLGTSPFDPLDFFLANAKKRVDLVVGAVPTKLTGEHVAEWLPLPVALKLPEWMSTPKLSDLPGLEACATIRDALYDRRAAANVTMKETKAVVDARQAELQAQRAKVPATAATVLSLEAASTAYDAARDALLELQAKGKRAIQNEERFASTRTRVTELRTAGEVAAKEAEALRVDLSDVATAQEAEDAAGERVRVARAELEKALAAEAEAEKVTSGLGARAKKSGEAHTLAAANFTQADELERTIGQLQELAPTPEELAAAEASLKAADDTHELALLVDGIVTDEAELVTHTEALKRAEEAASELTTLVDFWRLEAPKKLLAEAQGIDGLLIEGDAITLDGIAIDALSGREQMRFAVEIARRANAKTKILIVDGLERLDPDQMEAFVADATRDGWQLLGTRVERGDVKLVAIETDEAEAAQ